MEYSAGGAVQLSCLSPSHQQQQGLSPAVPLTPQAESKQPPRRPLLTHAPRPSLVRSYSTSDPSNDAFTVSHELDFDDWMSTVIGSSQLLVSSAVLGLGVYLLLTCPDMAVEAPLLFYFVVFSLSAELALLLVLCCCMLLLRLCCGPTRAEYSSAMCGLLHRTMEGAIYFLCVGFGASLLLLLATGDSRDPRVKYLRQRQEFVWAFVGLEVALCLLYCLQTIPTLFGICKFISHKIYLKLTGREELEFQRGDVPVAYARLADYDLSLQQMHNPLEASRAPQSPPAQQSTAATAAAQVSLLSDRV